MEQHQLPLLARNRFVGCGLPPGLTVGARFATRLRVVYGPGMGLFVHHINCGTMCPVAGRPGHMVCHCLVVETDAGLVLVDTGFGRDDLADARRRLGRGFMTVVRPRLETEELAVCRVEGLGFKPSDVRHIILTHMDVDHAGGIADFPHAVVHVTGAEHARATAPESFHDRFRYRRVQWAHGPDWSLIELAGAPWRGFAAARELPGLPPEIVVLGLPGHSAGHAGVAIDTGDGWLVHAGDAYFFHREVDPVSPTCPFFLRTFQRMVQDDGPSRLATQARLRDLVRDNPDVTVTCAHDAAELSRLAASDPRATATAPAAVPTSA